MLRSAHRTAPWAVTTRMTTLSTPAVCFALQAAQRTKYVRQPSAQWDPVHEDINAHVKRRIPGETRVDRVKRFAREWRNVELELGVYKDSRGREVKYRKTFVYRYTYPNAFDEFWWPCK
ncbi:hypothetical protein CUR178_06089 [Leishmania enriettii]|uniref:Uncharacterized protein n=1 Tax=Leishmania enriettii TaxID=5663 RepID=A0A836HSQ3_LEIEN|nr:hypothetical protein CUR178_06089 [Leishmania enriettii]